MTFSQLLLGFFHFFQVPGNPFPNWRRMPMLLVRLSSDKPVRILRPDSADRLDHALNNPLIIVIGVLPTGSLDTSQILHVLEPTMTIRHEIYQLNNPMAHIY
ncbi:hypothetical protein [Cupriavidus malaysiensis]|uniref:hypothetical protein n=1 Tax=Cupriavidus malaysiensis TaxID=367825 RepID=UPI0012FFAF79|nr:hypothetical protein [Cupriavidus malaysiensis]